MPDQVDDIFTSLDTPAPPPPPEFLNAVAKRRCRRHMNRVVAAAAVVGGVALVALPVLLLWPSGGATGPLPGDLPGVMADGPRDQPSELAASYLPTAFVLQHLNRDLDIDALILPEIANSSDAGDGGLELGRCGMILDPQRMEAILMH